MGPDEELPVTTVPGETAAVEPDTTTAADLTSAPEAAAEVRELVAQSLSQYLQAWWLKVRSGDSGVLPVLLAMVVVAVTFQIITPSTPSCGRATSCIYSG